MTISVEPLTEIAFSARSWGPRFGDESDDQQVPSRSPSPVEVPAKDVEWRHDAILSKVNRPVDDVTEGPSTPPPEASRATFVLVDGGATVVAMTRAEAIEAGYTVLDEDDSIETPTAGGRASTMETRPSIPALPPAPAARHLRLLPSTPTSDERERIDDWLRSVSRNRGAKHAGPIPTRNLSVDQRAEELAVPTAVPENKSRTLHVDPHADLLPETSLPHEDLFAVASLPLDDLFAVDVDQEPSVAAAPDRTVRLVTAPPQLDVLAGTLIVPQILKLEAPLYAVPTLSLPALSLPALGLPTQTVPVAGIAVSTQATLRAPLATTAPVLVAARSLTKTYFRNGTPRSVFRDLTIDVHTGEFLAIVGPSASGKTTLLNCLSGLESCDDGEVLFDGYPLSALTESDRARHRVATMGFAFPKPDLISVLTAVENVELPLSIAGWKSPDARAEATSALTLFRVADVANELPETLSAGERLRVSLARGVVGEPRIVWADDATAGLDPEMSDEIAHVLRELNEEGLAVVVATHDVGVLRHAHRIFELRDGILKEASRRKVLDACHRRPS